MFGLVPLVAMTQQEVLPYEEQILARARKVLEAAHIDGAQRDLGPIRERRFYGRVARLTFQNATLSWLIDSQRITEYQSWFPISGNRSTLPDSQLEATALRAFAQTVDPGYTFYVSDSDKSDLTCRFYFEVCRAGIPVHAGASGLVEMDRRTGRIAAFRPSYLDGDISQAVRAKPLPPAVLRKKAIDAYFALSPLGLAGVHDSGLRLLNPKTKPLSGPNPNHIPTVDQINPKILGRPKAPILAYSVHFGWQTVILDAQTGECLNVTGFDLGYSPILDVEGGTWHAVGHEDRRGRLKETKTPVAGPYRVVSLLSSNGIAARGAFHRDSGSVSMGYRTYQVHGDLLEALRNQ